MPHAPLPLVHALGIHAQDALHRGVEIRELAVRALLRARVTTRHARADLGNGRLHAAMALATSPPALRDAVALVSGRSAPPPCGGSHR